jgi:hypothetical protein
MVKALGYAYDTLNRVTNMVDGIGKTLAAKCSRPVCALAATKPQRVGVNGSIATLFENLAA